MSKITIKVMDIEVNIKDDNKQPVEQLAGLALELTRELTVERLALNNVIGGAIECDDSESVVGAVPENDISLRTATGEASKPDMKGMVMFG